MDKKFKPQQVEEKIYQSWEKNGYFKGKVNDKKKPFSIILPPPNANADLHLGHAMYVYEDIMIRYHKLLGFETLWLPGADHAGFETQYVFEKHLQKKGRSRFDYDRETLYKMVLEFVMKNKGSMEDQLRRLGFSLDWSKMKFALDEDIVKIVYQTFKKLFNQGLVYRAKRLVNYCTLCGTSFSDLEVVYKEKKAKLWFVKYPLKDFELKGQTYITVATTRPETILGDTGIAVSPKDKRYKDLIGKRVIVPLINKEILIVADKAVDPEFGTGVVKVTPGHDFTDFDIGERHDFELKQIIDYKGRLNKSTGKYQGLSIKEGRKKVIADLEKYGLLEKIKEDYTHRVGTCYKCNSIIEPLPKEQWFIKIKPLADKATLLVKKGKIKIYPKRFKKILIDWFDRFHDWNISRQIVWGIRIPAYQCQSQVLDSKQERWFVSLEKPEKCQICGKCNFKQDKDTFDTWFSSAQWPYATLLSQKSKIKSQESFFDYFYPTSVMETGYDILPWWVARMIMIGYFSTKKEPFKTVFLHGLVRDNKGRKMSKSKGNVVNPLEIVDKYGADALRGGLLFGVKEGNNLLFSEEKVKGMRNFANKIWNIGRFIYINQQTLNSKIQDSNQPQISRLKIIEQFQQEFKQEKKEYLKLMDGYQFSKALGLVYEFLWHRFADYYLEELKQELRNDNIEVLKKLEAVFFENLKMLHPFMPFVTDAVWKVFNGEKSSILKEKL